MPGQLEQSAVHHVAVLLVELLRGWSSASFGVSPFIQTELPCLWSSASFGVLLNTDRTILPSIISKFWCSSLFRQNYLAVDHRRVLEVFFIETELPRLWSSATEFWSSSLFRQNYLAFDHPCVLVFFLIQTETISPLIIGKFWCSSIHG